MKITNLLVSILVVIATSTIVIAEKSTPDSKKLFVATIPKSGTHLVGKLITEISGREWVNCETLHVLDQKEINQLSEKNVYMSHAPCLPYNYSLVNKNKLKTIVLIRDPRDLLISLAFWVKKHPKAFVDCYFFEIDALITYLIRHYNIVRPEIPKITGLKEVYTSFLAWNTYPDHLITKFEDLVGSQGGGDDKLQEQEIMRIAQFMNKPLSKEEIKSIHNNLFGGTKTFREGKIGEWKKYFSDEQKQLFKEAAGDLLIQLSYETSMDW